MQKAEVEEGVVADEDGAAGSEAGFIEAELLAESLGGGAWEVVVVEEQRWVEGFGEGTADEGFDDVSES